MIPILTIIAIVLAVYGIVCLIRGQLAIGIGSLLAAALIGPAGISIFSATGLMAF